MNLSITDPAFLFPGISLLFLAYTNRYMTLASIVRALNKNFTGQDSDDNRAQQIRSLHLRILLIKYMQASGVIAFLFCIASMFALVLASQSAGEILFVTSLAAMSLSLFLALIEILISGQSLKLELDRTDLRKKRNQGH